MAFLAALGISQGLDELLGDVEFWRPRLLEEEHLRKVIAVALTGALARLFVPALGTQALTRAVHASMQLPMDDVRDALDEAKASQESSESCFALAQKVLSYEERLLILQVLFRALEQFTPVPREFGLIGSGLGIRRDDYLMAREQR